MAYLRELVTVVGVSRMDPAKQEVRIGDQLFFEKELTNPDPFAIRAYLKDDKADAVGYIANSSNTVIAGTKSATQVHPLCGESLYGNVVDIKTVTFSNGRESKAFKVELHIPIIVPKEEPKMKTITFKLVGSKMMFPHKFKLINEANAGNKPLVTLSIQNGEIVADFEGGLAGRVDDISQAGLSEFDEIMSSIQENGTIAKITQVIGTNVVGEFTVSEEELNNRKAVQTLKNVCKQIIDDGLATKEEIEERISYMEKYGVTEKQMLKVFASYTRYEPDVAKRIPLRPETLYHDTTGILKRTIGYANARRNMMFEGDKGVGKNVLVETLAWIYKRPLYEFSLNSQHDNNSLLGGKTIETDEDGKTKMGFDLEATIEAAVHGGVLVLDEFNTSLAHAMSLFNSLLDDRRRIQVPGYGLVKAHENFFAIAAQNRDYQGTFENNEATADRFIPIIFPKLDTIKEILIAKVPGISLTVVNQLETLYLGVKKMVEDGNISDKAITIRGFIDACKAIDEDIPLKDALMDNVANRCNDLDDRKAVALAIDAAI